MNKYIFWYILIFILGLMLFLIGLYMIFYDYFIFMDWEIIMLHSCSITMTLLFDWMSMLFMGSVMLISSMVIYYSCNYMENDINNLRFLFLILFFILSMMFMIISPNLISILLGWDGLGLISYCLVIYFQNYKSYNAGMLTILINRIGDVSILLGIALMLNNGSWHFFYQNFYFYNWSMYLFFLIILAAFTKSAQIPFSSWLPAAMAAPTPVSALVHSSTLVTAGVYLLIRFSSLLYNFNMSIFLMLSMLTMFMSGLGANFEYDLKKIIALSTLSQLGLMMSILFMGFYEMAFLHLLTHAFFKALLFLCAGLIIHCMNDSQDIRHMGNLVNQLPYTSTCFSISNMSLCGLPFLSGFYSKDMILELMTFNYFNLFIYLFFFMSVGLTVSYSMRLVYYCMINYSGLMSYSMYYENKMMMYSMILLTFMSIFGGSMLLWMMFPYPQFLMLPLDIKLMPMFFIIMGGWLGYELPFMYYTDNILGLKYNLFIMFLGNMWFMPNFSTYMIYSKGLILSEEYFNFMDMSWGEYLMSNLLTIYFIYLSKLNLFYQNNNLKLFYCSFIILVFIFIII
nr:NADH dehydrogenase subunit 5 [Chorosoma macilentum]